MDGGRRNAMLVKLPVPRWVDYTRVAVPRPCLPTTSAWQINYINDYDEIYYEYFAHKFILHSTIVALKNVLGLSPAYTDQDWCEGVDKFNSELAQIHIREEQWVEAYEY